MAFCLQREVHQNCSTLKGIYGHLFHLVLTDLIFKASKVGTLINIIWMEMSSINLVNVMTVVHNAISKRWYSITLPWCWKKYNWVRAAKFKMLWDTSEVVNMNHHPSHETWMIYALFVPSIGLDSRTLDLTIPWWWHPLLDHPYLSISKVFTTLYPVFKCMLSVINVYFCGFMMAQGLRHQLWDATWPVSVQAGICVVPHLCHFTNKGRRNTKT